MAYVLGFFTADGSMTKNKRGAHFIEFEITDKDLLYKIKQLLGSNHKITEIKRGEINVRWKNIYRLQIGSKEIFSDLLKIGLTPAKSKTVKLPKIPKKYFNFFVRGYFDGDGCISFGIYRRKDRKSKKYVITSRFTSGSNIFLQDLLERLRKEADIIGGFICSKNRGFDLVLSAKNSRKLFDFMYNDLFRGLFLERKYNKFKISISCLV